MTVVLDDGSGLPPEILLRCRLWLPQALPARGSPLADTLGGAILSSFISQEGGSNDAYLYAAITPPSNVPEPSSIVFLFTVGAAIVVPLRRRLAKA